jgi:hypothetical protein
MGRVYSPEELAGSEVVSDAPAPAQPPPKPVKTASAPPKPAAAAPAAKRVYSPAELAGSEVVSEGDEEAPTLSQGSAALHTAAQGAQLGLTDELMGAGGAVGELAYHVLNEGRLPTGKELRDAYTSTRDEERQTVAAAHKFYPKTALASEIAGGLAVPLPGGGAANTVKAVGLGRKALAAARALAPVAATGAVAGVGYQDSGEGNIASAGEDVGAAGAGAGAGIATGLAVKAAGNAIKAGPSAAKTPYMWLRNRLGRGPEEIKSAIMDEIATMPNGRQVRDTVKKHLARAGDAIYDEVITGPDARTVQRAYQAQSAKEGVQILQPVIDKLDAQRERLYGQFEQAGVHVVDVPNEYVPRLMKASQAARDAGDKHMADGLEGIAEMITGEAEKTKAGGTTMKWLRSHQTALQSAAASKIGGLEEHETAVLARHVAEEAKGVLDDVFVSKASQAAEQGRLPLARVQAQRAMQSLHEATGSPAFKSAADRLANPRAGEQLGLAGGINKPIATPTSAELLRATQDIKTLNQRYYANLTLKDALEAKAVKEGVAGGRFERLGKKTATVLGGGGLGAAAAGPVGFAAGTLAGAAVAAAPQIGREIDRKLTSAGIERLRQAASGQSGEAPIVAIRKVAQDFGLGEREVRAAYIRLVVNNQPKAAEAAEQP